MFSYKTSGRETLLKWLREPPYPTELLGHGLGAMMIDDDDAGSQFSYQFIIEHNFFFLLNISLFFTSECFSQYYEVTT